MNSTALSNSQKQEIERQVAGLLGRASSFHQLPSAHQQQIKSNTAKLVERLVTQAERMVDELEFPAFVANLIEGTFQAIIQSSIEQMTAYAELIKSISTSLDDFEDQDTTDNQARDHLVQCYPQHFQLISVDGQPKVGLKDGGIEHPVPDFRMALGMSEDISSLDENAIEEKLVPAVCDLLARGRQRQLLTTILMGINRIVVTDGKINANIEM